MGKFSGILICTDLDGTIFKNDKTISRENVEAMEYFKSEGGYFTFVTGRMPYYVSYARDSIKPNAPIGCANGGGLYDTVKNEYVWKQVLPKNVTELIEHIERNMPGVGIQVSGLYKSYFYKDNEAMIRFRNVSNLENIVCHYNDVTEDFGKIIFSSDINEEIIELEKMLKSHPMAPQFDFIRSEKTLFEILPKGVSKGTSISKLCEHLNIDIKKTIAIGDYNNDIPMFKSAGVGIAVSNACAEAIEAADMVTVSNEESAIAKVIYDIESGEIVL